jgi:hypothetical protein
MGQVLGDNDFPRLDSTLVPEEQPSPNRSPSTDGTGSFARWSAIVCYYSEH